MFSWQSSFYLQFIIDKYEKEINDEEREKIVRALVSYHSPDLLIKFILAKGNPQMLSPTAAYNLYSIIIDYCMDVDYQIGSFTIIQIIDYLMKILNIRQIPKLFQKIEPFFFVVFGHTLQEYPEQEVEKIYQSLKGISILPLTFFSFSPISQAINKKHKSQKIITNKKHGQSLQTPNNDNPIIENKNFIASEIFSILINSADSYLNSPRSANIWIESLSALFRSDAKFDFDLLTIYSICEKISMSNTKSEGNSKMNMKWNYELMPFYFKAHFFDSLSYFLSPMNSLQIAKTHFFKLSDQINNLCTVEDLSSFIQYSRHLIELLKENEISTFTVDMISEIIFSTILPHFRKSKKLEESFKEFCELLDQHKLEDFVNTHFTTSSISAQQYLLSHFPNNEQDIEILFKEPIDSNLLHLYIASSYNIKLPNVNILKYLVHFFEYADLSDFKYLTPLYKKNPYLFCAKVIQYMSICDNFEKMTFLLSFLMDELQSNENHHDECPIVIYSSSGEYDSYSIDNNNKNLNDSTNIISLDLAFLSVMYKAIQFPNNQKMKCFYCFLDYLRQCKQCSVNCSYSPNTIAQALNSKFDSAAKATSSSSSSQEMMPQLSDKSPSTPKEKGVVNSNSSNLERTPVRTPKMTRRLSIDKQPTPQDQHAQNGKEQQQQQQPLQQSNSKQGIDTKHLTLSVPKRRLSDADSPALSQNSPYGVHSPFSPLNSSMQKEINQAKNSLVRQSSRDVFSTPQKKMKTAAKRKFKSKNFDINNHYSQMANNYSSINHCFYIKELISSVKFWDESLLSLMYLKIADGDLHYGCLVSFFTKTFSVINQIGKIVSTSSKLLKLFFATTLTMNNEFLSEVMKYIFYHGDLIPFRIELVLHSLLATDSIKRIDDTVFELLKIGFSNKYYDLTCSVISSLFKGSSKRHQSKPTESNSSNNNISGGIDDDDENDDDDDDDVINNVKLTSLNLYGSGYFSKKLSPFCESDPEDVFLIMCENCGHCDPFVFIDAFRSIYNLCYEKVKFKLSSEKVIKTVCHSLIEADISCSNANANSDIEMIFLSNSIKKEQSYYESLRNAFVKELKMKHTKEIGYFVCLKRVSHILSFDEMKPLLSRLFLNICVSKENKEIQKLIKETFLIIFKDNKSVNFNNHDSEIDDLLYFIDLIDDSTSQKVIQDMFDTVNFQDEFEKEALFVCFRRLSKLRPNAMMQARPPLIPQIISTFSLVKSSNGSSSAYVSVEKSDAKSNSESSDSSDSSDSESDAVPDKTASNTRSYYNKYGSMFGAVFSMLAESDLVLFFNQLTLSPKCAFFDRIILDLCRCVDKDFQLFACIENEFSELIDQTMINYQFIFQILTIYIQYQPSIQNNNVVDLYPDLISSLLFILFLCVSESFIQNDPDILVMLQKPINHFEALISLPLMPLNNFGSFEKVVEIIPLPIFSNKVILSFISKCTKLNASKHHQHFEQLVEIMIIYFSQNDEVFQRLLSIYLNRKFNFCHSQFNSKISKILASSKRLSRIKDKKIVNDVFELAINKKLFGPALSSAILINDANSYETFLVNLNDLSNLNRTELNSKFLNAIQKAVNLKVMMKNEVTFYNVFDFVKFDIFNKNGLALKILDVCLPNSILSENKKNSEFEFLFRKLFFFFVGRGNFDFYLTFALSSYKEFTDLKLIEPRELEIMFYIVSNLAGIKENRSSSLVSEFFSNLVELKLSKEALTVSQIIMKQQIFQESPLSLTFPTVSSDSKDNMYHI